MTVGEAIDKLHQCDPDFILIDFEFDEMEAVEENEDDKTVMIS